MYLLSTLGPDMLNLMSILFPVVALRIAHSAIHLSYNRVRHRLVAFATSNVVLVMLWTNLLWAISN